MMLTRDELEEYRHVLGFNLWQIEKDYLQHLLLLFLYQRAGRNLVFKGGTALQKGYALNRFSIDLDFTSTDGEARRLIQNVSRDITSFGFRAVIGEGERTRTTRVIKAKIEGPLYDGGERTMTTLRLEISARRDVLLEPVAKEIVPVYADLRPYVTVMMDLREMLAEKVRALVWRAEAKDLYDLWFLTRKNVKWDVTLVDRKLSYYRLKFNKDAFLGKVSGLKEAWPVELKAAVSTLPPFEVAQLDIRQAISEI